MRLNSSWLEDLREEAKKLRSPVLPVGIFLVAILSILAYRDRTISSVLKPRIQPVSELLRLSPDCLYAFLVLFLIPLAFLLITRQNLRQYGLSFGKVKLALPLLVVFLAAFILFGILFGKIPSLQDYYGSGSENIRDAFIVFVTYLVYMWAWEFMNRGFLLLGLKKYVGVYAVYIQLVPFVIVHLGKPAPELYGSIPFGLVFGFYAYLVDSFIYCAFVHACFASMIRLSIGSG